MAGAYIAGCLILGILGVGATIVLGDYLGQAIDEFFQGD